MTPAQRAAYVAAVQREASGSHRLEPTVHGFRGKSSTALRARFGAEGVEVAAGDEQPSHQWRAEATRWGCEGELIPVTETTPEASDNRATYRRRGFDEWYVVGPLGIEQGFTVTAPPACRARGGEGVMIALASSGLRARLEPNGTAAALVDPTGKEVLRYTDLYVVDAAGNELSAELRVQAGALAIWFDDRGATYPVTVDPLIGVPQQTLIASDPAPSNDFGGSVALSGDTVVVGASGNADFEGAAYVFVRSGGTWSLQQKLTAGEDPITRRIFGTSVAVSGETLVVGAPRNGADSAAAYVFVRSGGTWSLEQKLTSSVSMANFGDSVALSGDTAIVGAPYEDSYRGAAYVFVRSGGTWSEQQRLAPSAPAPYDSFGASVALSEDTAVVGARGKDSYRGAAYAFVRSGGTWSEQQKLTAGDAVAEDFLGGSVALSGDTAVVGANGKDSYRGAAYVFVRSGGTWSEQQKLTASAPNVYDHFGGSVALSGDTAIVGARGTEAQGAAYVFVRSGGEWSQHSKETDRNPGLGDQFGAAVAVSGDTVVASAPLKTNGQGAVFVLLLRHADGDACASGSECASGFCTDGVCCNVACNGGACDACSVAAGAAVDGTCALFTGTACDDGDICTPIDTCQAGVCTGSSPCSGAGACAPVSGACTCDAGHAGSLCQYNDATTCSGHGAAQVDGSCTCDAGFAGASCNECATDHHDYPTCTFCRASTTCEGHGTCSATGSCACAAGYAGSSCQYSDAVTCNQHGTAQADGSCVCASGFTGATCASCAPEHYGPGCRHCAESACDAPDECHESATCGPDGQCSYAAKADGTPCSTGACTSGACVAPNDSGASGSGEGSGTSSGGPDGSTSGASNADGSDDSGGCSVARGRASASGSAAGFLGAVTLAAVARIARRRRARR
ncbi:MAG: hypothetical protein KF894_00595 [Labilithrix sp.]|nr:hypothetical protein [Labilithrix sp.]